MGIPADRLPDETLLAGFGTGDADLSLAFVRRFQRVVFGVALTVIGDPATAEDIAQQTFERAWRHAQVYDSRPECAGLSRPFPRARDAPWRWPGFTA